VSTIEERIALLGADPSWAASWTLGGTEFYGELMDAATNGVWLSCDPITPEEYAALDVPEGFSRSGVGRSLHDAAVFLRPPGALVDGPLETIEVDGRTFALVARPGRPEQGFAGVLVLPVYKHHRVLFAAGRTLERIDIGHGWSLLPQVTEATTGGAADGPRPERTLPEGWSAQTWTLEADLVVDIPYPARVAIFFNGDIFHGPVRLPVG
jgi:hypothetical protein